MLHYVATLPQRKAGGCGCGSGSTGPCPVCDVTCFERPRFFCGQLLTDVELTAEQTYTIDKNRLHNRALHGAGVVCGLRVQCDPRCNGWVTIAPGYAIDCCGNDIVICEPTPFDVIDAIRKYEAKKRGEGCIPPPPAPGRKEYCLSLVYEEDEAKPVTALARCNGGSSATRCEPSRIAEKFRVEIIERTADGAKLTTWLDKVKACFGPVASALETLSKQETWTYPNAETTVAPAVTSIREAIIAGYNTLRIRCALPRGVHQLQWPSSMLEKEIYAREVYATASTAISSVYQFLIDCFCEALLIECPECTDPRVVIACVEIEGNDTFHICNTARRHVITFPSLGYWLAPLTSALAGGLTHGRAHSIAELIEYLCCGLDLLREGFFYKGLSERMEPEVAVRTVGTQAAYHAGLINLGARFVETIPGTPLTTFAPTATRIFEPGAQPGITVHNQTPEFATSLLRDQGYTVASVRPATPEELPKLMVTAVSGISRQADVELLTGPDGRVLGAVPKVAVPATAAAAAPSPVSAAAHDALASRVTILESRVAAAPSAAPATALDTLATRVAGVENRLSAAPPAAPAAALDTVTARVSNLENRLAAAPAPAPAAAVETITARLTNLENRVSAAPPAAPAATVAELAKKVTDIETRVAAAPPVPAATVEALTARADTLEARLTSIERSLKRRPPRGPVG